MQLPKGCDCHGGEPGSQVVGAGRHRGERARRRARPDRAQPGAAHDRDRPARLDQRPAVDLQRLQPGAGGRDAARGHARRPAGAQEGAASRARPVRGQFCAVRVRVRHRRADRGAGGARDRCGGHLPAVAVGDPGAVRPGGAAAGNRADGVGHLHQLPDRPDRRRLPARPLLVGLGVPDQRAGGGAGRDRRRAAAARVAQRGAAADRRRGRNRVQRGAGRADLRVHQGGPGRLDRRRGARRPRRGGVIRPLIELRLFRSAGFTWGTTLSTLISFAMFGIFFAMPQYFQEVRGADAMGSGLRLLPMIGGMVIGMIGSTRLASPRRAADGTAGTPLASVKGLVAVGFAIMAVTLGFGATTTVSSGTGFAAAWFAVFGLGLGLAMPQTMNAALSALSAETSGSGSALISALRQVGATIGVAVLGTVLSSVYRSHLVVTGLPDAVASAAKSSVVAGVAIAHKAGSVPLLDSVRHAFVTGMDTMLWACGGIALASAILAVIFLPRRTDGGAVGTADAGAADDVRHANGAERAELEA